MHPLRLRGLTAAIVLGGLLAALSATPNAVGAKTFGLIQSWGPSALQRGPARYFTDVAADSGGDVFVVAGDWVERFTSNGQFVSDWPTLADEPQWPYRVSGIAADSAGTLYVAEISSNRVDHYAADGRLLGTWSVSVPGGIAVDTAGRVFVTDAAGVQQLDSSGHPVRTFRTPAPTTLAIDRSDDIFLPVANQSQMWQLAPDGHVAGVWDFPSSDVSAPGPVAVDPDGNVWTIVDTRLLEYSGKGRLIKVCGRLHGAGAPLSTDPVYSPQFLAFSPAGDLYVTDYELGSYNLVRHYATADRVSIACDTPVVSGVRLHQPRFRPAPTPASQKGGATLRFELSEPATVSIVIRRGRTVRKLSVSGRAGRDSSRLSGWIGGRRLRPGGYRATIECVDAWGNRSRPTSLRFRVLNGTG